MGKNELPDFDLDEPFAEDAKEVPLQKDLTEKARHRIELINSMVENEAVTEKSPPPVFEGESSDEERESLRKQSLLEIAWSEVTGQGGKDIEASWKNYFNLLPNEKMSLLSALTPASFKQIVKKTMEPKLVDLMAEDRPPTIADIEEIEPSILKQFEDELKKRKSEPPKMGDFFQTGT
jgi:hypothetical protein